MYIMSITFCPSYWVTIKLIDQYFVFPLCCDCGNISSFCLGLLQMSIWIVELYFSFDCKRIASIRLNISMHNIISSN